MTRNKIKSRILIKNDNLFNSCFTMEWLEDNDTGFRHLTWPLSFYLAFILYKKKGNSD